MESCSSIPFSEMFECYQVSDLAVYLFQIPELQTLADSHKMHILIILHTPDRLPVEGVLAGPGKGGEDEY